MFHPLSVVGGCTNAAPHTWQCTYSYCFFSRNIDEAVNISINVLLLHYSRTCKKDMVYTSKYVYIETDGWSFDPTLGG